MAEPQSFPCPSCGVTLAIPAYHGVRWVNCTECRRTVELPGQAEVAPQRWSTSSQRVRPTPDSDGSVPSYKGSIDDVRMNKPMIAGGGLMMLSSVVWFFWGILALGLLFRAAVILFAFGAFAVYQGVKGEDA